MATVKISELPAILGANTAATDVIPIVDVSGNITNKITREEFFKNIQGNVGIGTSSPQAILHVEAPAFNSSEATATAGLFLKSQGGTTGDGNFSSGLSFSQINSARPLASIAAVQTTSDPDQGGLAFLTHSSSGSTNAVGEAMRITHAGNVGIGTSSPATNLHVQGTETNIRIQGGSATFSLGAANTGGRFYIFDNTASAERLTISSTGLIGVGTNTPTALLTIGSSTPRLDFLETGGSAGFDNTTLVRDADVFSVQTRNLGTFVSNDYRMTTNASGALTHEWRIANTERMRIDSSGNVGIGNTAPVVPLHVTGDTMTTGVVYKNQPAQAIKTAAATLTIAELENGLIQYTGAAATLTLPTGTSIETGTPNVFPVDMAFDFSVINTGSGTATLGTATGLTLVGSMAVTAGVSGMFRVRKTATNTYTVYRIG